MVTVSTQLAAIEARLRVRGRQLASLNGEGLDAEQRRLLAEIATDLAIEADRLADIGADAKRRADEACSLT